MLRLIHQLKAVCNDTVVPSHRTVLVAADCRRLAVQQPSATASDGCHKYSLQMHYWRKDQFQKPTCIWEQALAGERCSRHWQVHSSQFTQKRVVLAHRSPYFEWIVRWIADQLWIVHADFLNSTINLICKSNQSHTLNNTCCIDEGAICSSQSTSIDFRFFTVGDDGTNWANVPLSASNSWMYDLYSTFLTRSSGDIFSASVVPIRRALRR